MKKLLFLAVILCFSFSFCSFVFAEKRNAKDTVKQVGKELKQKGELKDKEFESIKPDLEEMAQKGASKEDLKNALSDLSRKGVRGDDLKNSVKAMHDLVDNGESPKEAGNIVSRAAHKALAEGLKGEALAERVYQAIRERKMQMQESKE